MLLLKAMAVKPKIKPSERVKTGPTNLWQDTDLWRTRRSRACLRRAGSSPSTRKQGHQLSRTEDETSDPDPQDVLGKNSTMDFEPLSKISAEGWFLSSSRTYSGQLWPQIAQLEANFIQSVFDHPFLHIEPVLP